MKQAFRCKRNITKKRGISWLTVDQISEQYHFHPNTVRNWVNRDGLRCVRHGKGGKIFIQKEVLEDFLRQWYEFDKENK